MNKATYFQGPEGSGKTTAAGNLLDPLWELNICRLVIGDTMSEVNRGLESAIRAEKKYIHIDRFPALANAEFAKLLNQALEAQMVVIISSQAPPPAQIWGLVIWSETKPYPYRQELASSSS